MQKFDVGTISAKAKQFSKLSGGKCIWNMPITEKYNVENIFCAYDVKVFLL